MPVPKRKVSRSRRDKRSANKGIKPHIVIFCQTCQAPKTAHSLCEECGYYKGVKVMRTKKERAHERATNRAAMQGSMPNPAAMAPTKPAEGSDKSSPQE
ncbi:50S ribosomal protein L32 [Candidatus Dependentiae bacterium]|nr:MAG: 50S ribosomal protein L32 [Candidatus Dependentiae bacterium]